MTIYTSEHNVLYELSQQVGKALSQQGILLVTAESCTGGWLGQVITSVPGSSAWYDRGFITYSNLSKQETLGVQSSTLERFGAVSSQTAQEMVSGALNRSHAHIGVSITGIAGPGGGTIEKPIGMVCFAWAIKDGLLQKEIKNFSGDRDLIRFKAVETALNGLLVLMGGFSMNA